ncbi:MAG: radical SAM protein [Nanoarchaeota archaeon]|nr:radical SAM protein [Nanoarchaeota archaeon]
MNGGGIKNYYRRLFNHTLNIFKSGIKNPQLAVDYGILRAQILIFKALNQIGVYYQPKPKSIVSAKIELTQDCTSRCITCNFWRITTLMNGRKIDRKRLEHRDYIKLIYQLKKLHCNTIQWLGGETLLYKRVPELIKLCTELGIKTNIVTNGTEMTKDMAQSLVESGLNSITFSLDGPKEINDKVRGIKGAFEKQLLAIERIKNADKQNKLHKSISVTVSIVNLPYIEKVLDIANKINITEINYYILSAYNKQVKQNTDKLFKKLVGSLEFLVSPALIPKDEKLLKKKQDEILKKAKEYNIKIRGHLFTKGMANLEKGIKRKDMFCLAPYKFCVIDCYGYIYPCDLLRYPFGNIKETSIKKALNSKEFNKFSQIYLKKFKDIEICRYCPLYCPI